MTGNDIDRVTLSPLAVDISEPPKTFKRPREAYILPATYQQKECSMQDTVFCHPCRHRIPSLGRQLNDYRSK